MSQPSKGPWLREGRLVYALEHDRWRNGQEQFRNRFEAHVYGGPETPEQELEAVARLMQVAPALLEAVTHLFVCDFPDEVDFRCEGCTAARAAIREAEGRV
jgi:hypothetical protein